VLLATRGNYSGPNTLEVFPLRIAKQILTMFCSVRGPELATQHPDVQDFLLDKTRSGMPAGLRLYVHYALGTVHRYHSQVFHIDTDTSHVTPMSEFVWPPFGYLLTYGEPSPDPRPVEVTSYANYGFNDKLVVDMSLPLLSTSSPMPGDYRSPEELEAAKAENEKFLAEWQAKRSGV
jgi:hypothetical protein